MVEFGTVLIRDGAFSLTVTAWFDPSAGYLPRKIDLVTTVEKPDVVEGRARQFQQTLEVSKFQEVFDPAAKQNRNYPSRGRSATPLSLQEIVVDLVQLGPQLDATAFRPKLASGVVFREEFKDRPAQTSIIP
jgi:hypothetical protein